ncbi:HesA/MoeB/ThiF family protein [Frondihabitans australicus]|uniref:Adenylyltransferase/sulfurtransferase n=1 Tax=Frondihabitans australicus TaxID=386892 RepID=A0A495IBF1_9MICO|nr:HesA/MoeB/ThiF family protein [Frondihabitans australicus]RKR73327.1 adenylyltransferase/sulfurtransferase [Frondihabitans australicus]
MRLPGGGEDARARLARASVLVVGAGGLGSPVVALLAGSGIGRLTVVDPDRVELSNLSRQTLFSSADVGRSKAEVAVERAASVDPDLSVVALVGTFRPEMVAGHDVVIDAADSSAVTRAVSDACAGADIPWVWGAVLGFDGQASTFWDSRGIDFHDLHPVDSPDSGSCEIDGVLPALCHAIGAVMASQVVAIVAGIGEPLLGAVVSVDASTWEWSRTALRRGPSSTRPSRSARVAVPELRAALSDSAAVEARPVVVDVRTDDERATGGIPGSTVPGRLPESASDLVVVCERGPRAEAWAISARSRVGARIRVLDGGMAAWRAAGGPLDVSPEPSRR